MLLASALLIPVIVSYSDVGNQKIEVHYSSRGWAILHLIAISIGSSSTYFLMHTSLPNTFALGVGQTIILATIIGATDQKLKKISPETLIVSFVLFLTYAILNFEIPLIIVLGILSFGIVVLVAKVLMINGGDALCLGFVTSISIINWNYFVSWPLGIAAIGISLVLFSRYAKKEFPAAFLILGVWSVVSFGFAISTTF